MDSSKEGNIFSLGMNIRIHVPLGDTPDKTKISLKLITLLLKGLGLELKLLTLPPVIHAHKDVYLKAINQNSLVLH